MYTRSVKVRTKFKVKLYIFDVSFRFETTARRKRVGSKMIIEANFYTFRPSMKFRNGGGPERNISVNCTTSATRWLYHDVSQRSTRHRLPAIPREKCIHRIDQGCNRRTRRTEPGDPLPAGLWQRGACRSDSYRLMVSSRGLRTERSHTQWPHSCAATTNISSLSSSLFHVISFPELKTWLFSKSLV